MSDYGFPQTGYACEDCEVIVEVVGHEVETVLCPECGEPMSWNHESGEYYHGENDD